MGTGPIIAWLIDRGFVMQIQTGHLFRSEYDCQYLPSLSKLDLSPFLFFLFWRPLDSV